MRTATYNLNLRVGAGITPIVKVSQNDEGRSIGFRLFDGALAYLPGATAEVTITGTKPSGLGFTETCSVSGSVAVVETTLAMTQESGQINAELRISDGELDIGTSNFVLYVEPAPHPAGTTDGTTEEARTVLEQCEEYAQAAQDAAEAASGDYTQLSAEIGTLSELTTTAKGSAVAAINEVNSGLSELQADLGALQDGGYVADQQKIQEKIDDWLEEHPEATTTVQDGSITEQKIHLNAVTTPKIQDGAITDDKTADAYKNLFYDEVTVSAGRTSNTDYYIAEVPKYDDNNELIPLKLTYSATLNPLEQAWENNSTITINGYGELHTGSGTRNGIGICDGVTTTNFSFEGIAPDCALYLGVKADRTIVEYKMNSSITANDMKNDGCLNVFNCYFKLVENGAVVNGLANGEIYIGNTQITEETRNPLMLMGLKSDGTIMFMACDGRTIINDGLTYREAGELLISQGCSTVYNLDGGGSACLVVKGSKLNRNIDGDGTVVRKIRYALNVIKPSANTPTKKVYQKIGEEKQNLIGQIIPYINGLQSTLITKLGTVIKSNTDLNDVVKEGKYFCAASSVAITLVNCPVTVGFSMYVLKQGGTNRGYMQMIVANPISNKLNIYNRFVSVSTSGVPETATPWYVITSTAVE